MARLPILLLTAMLLHAGEDGLAWFDPRPVDAPWRAGGEWREDRSGAADDGGRLGVDRATGRLSVLAERVGTQEFWPEARVTRSDLHGDLRLQGQDPTGTYLDAGVGMMWRQRRDDGRILGLSAAATWSGRSDVAGGLRSGITVAAFARLPLAHPGDGVLMALGYDSQSALATGVRVLPIAAWQGMRGPWMFVLGVPFSVVRYRGDGWNAAAAAGPSPMLGGDLRLAGPVSLLGEARFASLQLRPASAPAIGDRLYLTQWEWAGGLRCAAGPARSVDLVAGWSAGRRIGYGRLLSSRRDGERLAPEPFLALRGRWSF